MPFSEIKFSPRQTQVAALLLDGFGKMEISRRLKISVRAVGAAMEVMCIKLGIDDFTYRQTRRQKARVLAITLAKRGCIK